MSKQTATAEQLDHHRAVIAKVKGSSLVQYGKIGWFFTKKGRCTGLGVRFSASADLTVEDLGWDGRFEPIEAVALW